MPTSNVLIIGVTGCVGHYLFDVFANDPNYHLHLPMRDSAKIYFDPKQFKNVTRYSWRLSDLLNQKEFLMQMDYVIHLATPWGGNYIWQTNIGDIDKLFTILGESTRLKKIIYFSTASILGTDGKVTDAALKLGTGYIRSKYLMHLRLPRLKVFPKIITVFPTWVFGGDQNHPYSHASEGIPGILKLMGILRFIRFDFKFHFMHAMDIATTVKGLIEGSENHGEYVLGQGPYSFNQLIADAARVTGNKVGFQIPISFGFISGLAWLLRKPIAPWDRYCFNRKDFIFKVINPEQWQRHSQYPRFTDILDVKKIRNFSQT